MLTKSRKLDVLFLSILLIVSGFYIGTNYASSFTGVSKTLGDDFIEVENVNATYYYLDDTNVTDILAYPVQGPDFIIFSSGANYYGLDGATGQIDYSSTDAKVTYNNCRADLTGGGWIHFGPGTFVFSGEIYLQSESGGGIPDFDTYCILTGNGASGTLGTDSGATILQFPAGSDGVIIDMHTNNGGWYTRSSIRDLSIGGTFGNNMGSAIKLMKTADVEVDSVTTHYTGANGHPAFHVINAQMLRVERYRHYNSIEYEIGVHIENTDGVAYTEQGGHQTWTRCSVGNDGTSGQIAWLISITNGTANLSDLVFIDCEAMMSGSFPAAPRFGWKINNTAGAFEGFVWIAGSFEGGNWTLGERNIWVDTNAGYFYGKLVGGSFPGSYTGIQMDHSTSRLILEQVKNAPDNIAGPGQYFWYHTDTPGNIVAGTNNVFAGSGSNVFGKGQASITGAVNSVTVAHGVSMSLSSNLPTIDVTALQASGETWTSGKNATHFDINFENQPGGATWYFDWEAIL